MNVTNRKMFRPRNARNKLNQMGGIMASSPELMQTVQRYNVGGPVGTQQQINRGNVGVGVPTINPPTNIGARSAAPPYARVGSPPTLPYATQIMDFLGNTFGPESPEEVQQRVAGARSLGETFGVPENAPIRNVVPDFLKPQEGPARGIFTDMTLEEEAAAVGLGPEVGRRITDPAEIARLRATPEGRSSEVGRRITDPAEIARLQNTPEGRASTAKDAQEFLSVLPEVTPEQVQSADPRDQARLGQEIKNQATDFLASDADETEKNDAILTLLGKKDPSKTLSKKERIEKNKEFYREIFKQDPKEDEKVDGYNLAMMGFLIASGDSPNALQNIARGAAAGLKNFQETRKSRQAREDKLTERAVADYRSQVESEAKREEFIMGHNLKIQELLDKRSQAKTKADQERFDAILGSVNNTAGALVLAQFSDLDELKTQKGQERFKNAYKSLVSEIPSLLDADSGFRKGRLPEETIDNSLTAYFKMDRINQLATDKKIRAELGLPENQLITREIARRYYTGAFAPGSGGASSGGAPAPQGPPVISTREEYDALPSGTPYEDSEGNQGVKP